MTNEKPVPWTNESRRRFLKQAATLAGSAPFAPALGAAVGAATMVAVPLSTQAQSVAGVGNIVALAPGVEGYQSLSPDEAAFVETLVNVMCPADELTPGGVDCGLAVFIDRQLAGGYGKGERRYMRGPWVRGKPQQGYQLPLTPEQFFKAGIAVANDAARQKFGVDFADLAAPDADAFLLELAAGAIKDPRMSLAMWFEEIVYPLFVQACFADPIYGGNQDKVFWRMVGYPGLPALHTQDMVEYRGKPYPGARNPLSIVDFS